MIRPYLSSDTEAIIEVWYQASLLAHPFLKADFLEKEKQNIREVYLPNTQTWVYHRKGQVLGFLSMIGNEVGAIFLHPAYHGRGIGSELMDMVEADHETLEVEVFEKNNIGRAFYERYGFEEVSRRIHEETGEELIRLLYS